jgi:hypothetical protein
MDKVHKPTDSVMPRRQNPKDSTSTITVAESVYNPDCYWLIQQQFCDVQWKLTDVSEELIASIFRAEEFVTQEISMKQNCHCAVCFILVSCLGYPSSLKLEATCCSETFVDFQHTAEVRNHQAASISFSADTVRGYMQFESRLSLKLRRLIGYCNANIYLFSFH